jgi:hypothetical protein
VSRAPSKEYLDEAVRRGQVALAGVVRLPSADVEALMRSHEAQAYLSATDFLTLFARVDEALRKKSQTMDSSYVTGIRFDVARDLMFALLRVLAPQRPLGIARTDEEQSNEELRHLRDVGHDAARVAVSLAELSKTQGIPPSLEDYRRLLRDTASAFDVESTLLAARVQDPIVRLADGQLLPSILPPPKVLASKHRHRVLLTIECVHESRTLAEVKIVRVLDGGSSPAALEGLLGQILPMGFTDRRDRYRRLLVGAQLTKEAIEASVGVTRALRRSDARLDRLELLKLAPSSDFLDRLDEQVVQLKLDFGAMATSSFAAVAPTSSSAPA